MLENYTLSNNIQDQKQDLKLPPDLLFYFHLYRIAEPSYCMRFLCSYSKVKQTNKVDTILRLPVISYNSSSPQNREYVILKTVDTLLLIDGVFAD